MTGWQIALWAAVGVLPFWALGAYNRVVALRGALVAAWAEFGEVVRRREPLLTALMQRLREPLADQHTALDTVVGVLAQLRSSLTGARPTVRGSTDVIAAYELDLHEAWLHVRHLIEQHPAAAPEQPPLTVQLDASLGELQLEAERMVAARLRFNDAAARYNAAIAQFPTSLLAPLFGFEPAGQL
jgi:LemA protein